MFDWQPYVGSELTAMSDVGNIYYIRPVNEGKPDGPWLCSGIMMDGTDYAPHQCEDRNRAEGYAEELEVEYHSA